MLRAEESYAEAAAAADARRRAAADAAWALAESAGRPVVSVLDHGAKGDGRGGEQTSRSAFEMLRHVSRAYS